MSLIRNWCSPYEVIADVGAGHGRLSIALAERQHRVYATERTAPGYAELISRVMGHPGIVALKGDGLQPLAPYKVDAVVVAGMGPGPIRHILDPRHEGPFIKRAVKPLALAMGIQGARREAKVLYLHATPITI